MEDLTILSPEFKDGDFIPDKYTCNGEDISPPLEIKDLPDNTQSIVIIMDDPGAPVGLFTHWLVWDLDKLSQVEAGLDHAFMGKNDFGTSAYRGPCPPSGTHRYFFRVYALDSRIELTKGSSRQDLENKMKGKILAEGQLMGKYSR